MKLILTQGLVWKLAVHAKPVETNGQVSFIDNPGGAPYIVFDAHPKAPPGFGIKIHKSGGSYLIQRRIGEKVIKAKLADVKDLTLADARVRAGEFAEEIRHTRSNPNAVALAKERSETAGKLTLDDALAMYRRHITGRATYGEKSLFRRDCDASRLNGSQRVAKNADKNLALLRSMGAFGIGPKAHGPQSEDQQCLTKRPHAISF